MRYGQPSLPAGLNELRSKGCDHIVVFLLYPHYASSSTGSTLEVVYRRLAQEVTTPFVTVVPPYYDDEGFISAFAAVGGPVLEANAPDHVLFSFHGLPERHMRNGDPTGSHCIEQADCCARMSTVNQNCYRAQCYATARALAARLGLAHENYGVSFQSRLGRARWIKPYTEPALEQLARDGVKRLAVFCPAFTADCLETLEEIGMRAVELFKAHGGEHLVLVPSLNAHSAWVTAASRLIEVAAGRQSREGQGGHGAQTGPSAVSVC